VKKQKPLEIPNSITLTSDDTLETETTMDFKHNLYIVKIGGKEVLREPLSGRISNKGKDMVVYQKRESRENQSGSSKGD